MTTEPLTLARLIIYCYAHERRAPWLARVRRAAQQRIQAYYAGRAR